MSKDILVVGSLNMDIVVRAARIPSPGETILGSALHMIPGGKGANQAADTSSYSALSWLKTAHFFGPKASV